MVKLPHSSTVVLKWLPCRILVAFNYQAKIPLKGRTSLNERRHPENMSK